MAGTKLLAPPKHKLGATHQRIVDFMGDGGWHSRMAILGAISANGEPPKQGLRPLRSLRTKGYVVHTRRSTDGHIYRIEVQPQGE